MDLNEKKARPWDLFNKNIEKVKNEVSLQRLDICKECKFLAKKTNVCKKCGCFMPAKTKLPHSECPIGKWGKVTNLYKETGE